MARLVKSYASMKIEPRAIHTPRRLPVGWLLTKSVPSRFEARTTGIHHNALQSSCPGRKNSFARSRLDGAQP